jgi:general stress protein 26
MEDGMDSSATSDAERHLVLDHLRHHDLAVLATSSPLGLSQAALMGIAATEEFVLIFDTLTTTRKYANLKSNPRVALVVGCEGEATVQFEGEAEELEGEALGPAKDVYFAAWPDGRDRETWPGITYFRVTPRWIRYSDFAQIPPLIIELDRF